MAAEFWKWLLGVATSAGALGVLGYMLRDAISKYLFKQVEHRFEKKLERYKGDIRDNEKELEQIRAYLVTASRERAALLQTKKFAAAESLMQARQKMARFTILIEYLKILDVEKLLDGSEEIKVAEFISTLISPFKLEEKLAEEQADRTLAKLYLTERTLKLFDAYEGIIIQGVMLMKLLSLPIPDRSRLMKFDGVTDKIVDLLPGTKDGFEKHGGSYAYYWATYFHDEILKSLRAEISGAEQLGEDAKSIENMALSSRLAHANVLTSLANAGLPKTILRTHSEASDIAGEAPAGRA